MLQALDVTVFAAFKSHLLAGVHQASRVKKVLDAFDIANIIRRVCDRSQTVDNIQSGFEKAGIWDRNTCGTYVRMRKNSVFGLARRHRKEDVNDVTLDEVVKSFDKKSRTLLRSIVTETSRSGTIKVITETGAHITSEACLEALKRSREVRRSTLEAASASSSSALKCRVAIANGYTKSAAEVEHLIHIRAERKFRRLNLALRRRTRRARATIRAIFYAEK